MSYDFYANIKIQNEEDIDNLISGHNEFVSFEDVFMRAIALANCLGSNLKDYAKVGQRSSSSGLKALIHSNGNYTDYLKCKISKLNLLGINCAPDISSLPEGSWYIQIPVTLKTPYYSKDDVPLYIIENPIRKDKVFGIPFTSAMSWKGNLRWTMMKTALEPAKDNSAEFAKTRFRHTLLFGTEKGMEETPTGWAEYLDNLCNNAKEEYRKKLREYFDAQESPSLAGMLYFYPTFWNRIDMMVINPHDRKTKTGKNPIYYEVVPEGAKGIFRLLYIPLHYIGRYESTKLYDNVKSDLKSVIEGLEAMMLTYGFSAKKSLGYGVVEDKWDREQSRIAVKTSKKSTYEDKFENFEILKDSVNKILEER